MYFKIYQTWSYNIYNIYSIHTYPRWKRVSGKCGCDNSKYVMPNMNNEQKTFFLQVPGNSILKLVESPVVQNAWQNWIVTLSETNSLQLAGSHPKRKLVFQPSIFRCKLTVSFREGNQLNWHLTIGMVLPSSWTPVSPTGRLQNSALFFGWKSWLVQKILRKSRKPNWL